MFSLRNNLLSYIVLFGLALFVGGCVSSAKKNAPQTQMSVTVKGAVSAPGVRYFLTGPKDKPTLAYALALSGEPLYNANLEEVLVFRKGFWGLRKIKVNLLKNLYTEKSHGFPLEDGDVIELTLSPNI